MSDELTTVDPSTIAPTKTHKDTGVVFPDLYNFMPSRVVTQAEAQRNRWPYFYEEKRCGKAGHMAPRFTANPRLCVSCHRVKCGKPALGAVDEKPEVRPSARRRTAATATVTHLKDQVTDESGQKFLTAYASIRDLDGAAKSVSWTVAQVEARIASDKIFREACERLGLKITPKAQTAFEWTEDKRSQLLEVWVNTGDIATARDSISVTPSEYLREIARNKDFAQRVDEAEPLANRMLVERAYQLALSGNDKLLNKILPAIDPEKFSERVKLDVHQTGKLTDTQLEARFMALLSRVRRNLTLPEAVDADVIEVPALPPPDNSDLV